VVDGKEDAGQYDEIRSISFSPDGSRFAFAARRGEGAAAKWSVVVDGREEKAYGAVLDGPVFSPDGRRVAYHALVVRSQAPVWSGGLVVVVDGKEWKEQELHEPPSRIAVVPPAAFETPNYVTIRRARLQFSPDSQHVAAVMWDYPGYRVFVDDAPQRWGWYRDIPRVWFSPDGKRLGYLGMDDRTIAVVEGEGKKVYEETSLGDFRISPDSKRLVLVTRGLPRGRGDRVRVDDAIVVESAAVGEVLFSPDGNRLAVSLLRNGVWVIEVDGKELPESAGAVAPRSLRFSPDSSQVAFVSGEGRVQVSVVPGGVERKQFPLVARGFVAQGSLTFSPTGNWLVYAVYGSPVSAKKDGRKQAPATPFRRGWQLVATDVAAHLNAEGKPAAVPIDAEGGTYDEIWAADGFAFNGPDSFFLVAVRGREFFRVECRIEGK
jgi:Tol biopolymer transport system component